MADNAPLPLATGSTRNAATDQVTYSGDIADVQLMRIVEVTGIEGSKTVISAGLALDGTDITTPSPAMPAGGVGIRGWLSAIWTKLNASLAVTGTFWQATQPVSLATVAVTNVGTFAVQAAATLAAETTKVIGTVNLAATPLPALSEMRSATLHVTGTAAANTLVTVTLPAVAGQFHYITNIHLTRNATAALGGTATLVHTSANLPGSPAWSVGNAMAAGGSSLDLNYTATTPLRSAVVNTATTITMPAAGAAVLNRINVSYFTAA